MRNSLQIEYRPIGDLKPRSRNARAHSKKQIQLIAQSMKQFGFNNPIIIDENDVIIAGHARLEAAKLNGDTTVPTILVSSMTEDEKRAYVIADNQLAQLAGWDFTILREEMQFLLDADLDFDIEIIGFEAAEIDSWSQSSVREPEEPVELPGGEPVVSEPGDLWIIGNHRLLCGNALEAESYTRLMAGDKAQMVFTDPPYNVPIAGNVSGLGRKKHGEFLMASGEMSRPEFSAFLGKAFAGMAEVSVDGAIHFICMDWKHIGEILEAGGAVYWELKNLCVWAKTNAGMGAFYRSKHELVLVWKIGTARHINNFGLGEKGRHRTNVWSYEGANTFRKGRSEDLADHPTVKPVQMVHDAILDCSKPGGIVLDAFAGVGTTLVAAHRAKRRGYGIELDPAYVDCALRRLQKETGEEPYLHTGESLAEVAARRLADEEAA